MAGYVARPDAVSGELDPREVGVVVLTGPSRRTAALCVADLVQVDLPLAEACRPAMAQAG